jgi:hypothetical protein
MNSLSFMNEEIQEEREPTIVEPFRDRHPSLDWERLKDCNDDYDEILFYPSREFTPDLDRAI